MKSEEPSSGQEENKKRKKVKLESKDSSTVTQPPLTLCFWCVSHHPTDILQPCAYSDVSLPTVKAASCLASLL